jgi:hypothetical protein
MKTPEQFLADVRRRLTTTWAATAAATTVGEADPSWPKAFPLGKVATMEAERGFAQLAGLAQLWRDWAASNNVQLEWQSRRLLGTPQQIPTHAMVHSADQAARLCGGGWNERLGRARARGAHLAARYPHLSQLTPADVVAPGDKDDGPGAAAQLTASLVRVLRDADAMTDTDFELLCRAADWFATHDAMGLTPRQVPIEGLHAKWLNSSRHLVRALAGVDDLGLLPDHPARIHFTYLDPDYRATGARLHDSATVGDTAAPAYAPQLVVISENKDTALYFPPLAEAISVEGVGRGGRTIASFPWLVDAPRVIYWGDMDADGLEILDEFRRAGVPAAAILMDPTSYITWERFGTNTDPKGRLLGPRSPRPVGELTPTERELYLLLCNPVCPGPRRIEQERLPFSAAMDAIRRSRSPLGLPLGGGVGYEGSG